MSPFDSDDCVTWAVMSAAAVYLYRKEKKKEEKYSIDDFSTPDDYMPRTVQEYDMSVIRQSAGGMRSASKTMQVEKQKVHPAFVVFVLLIQTPLMLYGFAKLFGG